MLHPLFRLLLARPELLAEHAWAYAELAARSTGEAVGGWRRRALWFALAGLGGLLGSGLAGVALMLWALQPALTASAQAALIAVPALPLALAALAAWLGWREPVGAAFSVMREQFDADLALMQRAAAT